MDVGDHTTTGDGRLDEGVELLVTTDGELKVAGGDALHLLRSEREGVGGVSKPEELSSTRLDREKNSNAQLSTLLKRVLHSKRKLRRSRARGARERASARGTGAVTHLEILGGVAGKLENLGGEVLCIGRGFRESDVGRTRRGKKQRRWKTCCRIFSGPETWGRRVARRRTKDGGGVDGGGGTDAATGGGTVCDIGEGGAQASGSVVRVCENRPWGDVGTPRNAG